MALGHGHTPSPDTGKPPWHLGLVGISCNLPPYLPARVRMCSHRGHPDSQRGPTHRVGLLCACSHMALGILMGLDQQLDEAGDDRCLLQWGVVGWAQGQIPDQADGCLARRGAPIKGVSWEPGGPQAPGIISSFPSHLFCPQGQRQTGWKVSREQDQPQPIPLIPYNLCLTLTAPDRLIPHSRIFHQLPWSDSHPVSLFLSFSFFLFSLSFFFAF